MKSNYEPIGKHIKLVDARNTNLKVKKLLGLSISKEFIPSVANIIGTDMENYKIIRQGQFACSLMQVRRDKKMPVALMQESEAIMSPAYPIFEVKDTEILLPEYLMMWFKRPEFDREACFYAVGGVRGSLEWDDFCAMSLPIPSIAKQREIVQEYQTIENRIKLNEQITQRLEETAQALYKQWFIDFEFPDEAGKPYKSNGGEMIDSPLGEIPKGWRISSLSKIASYLNGLALQKYPALDKEFLPVIKIRELNQGFPDGTSDKASQKIPKPYIIENGDVIFSWSGTLKVDLWCGGLGALNQHLFVVKSKEYSKWFYYIWTKYHLDEFIRIAAGKATTMGHIKREHLDNAKVLLPTPSQLSKMDLLMFPLLDNIIQKKIENISLQTLKTLLLSRLATVAE